MCRNKERSIALELEHSLVAKKKLFVRSICKTLSGYKYKFFILHILTCFALNEILNENWKMKNDEREIMVFNEISTRCWTDLLRSFKPGVLSEWELWEMCVWSGKNNILSKVLKSFKCRVFSSGWLEADNLPISYRSLCYQKCFKKYIIGKWMGKGSSNGNWKVWSCFS